MQLSHTLGGCTNFINDKYFPTNAIVLTLDNGMQLVCHKFNHSHKYKLELMVWMPLEKKWVKTYDRNKYTKMMWDYYKKIKPKKKYAHINYASLMKHDRVHKSGGGGSRIHNGSITDYECTKNPLHDFRRYYN